MVQRPFSESGGAIRWKNMSQIQSSLLHGPQTYPGFAMVKTMLHNVHRPRMSTIISSMETGRGRSTYTHAIASGAKNFPPVELRLARNTLYNSQNTNKSNNFPRDQRQHNNSLPWTEVVMQSIHKIPSSRFFTSVDENLQNANERPNSKEAIIIPNNYDATLNNNSLLVKGIYRSNIAPVIANKLIENQPVSEPLEKDDDSGEKVDFLIEETLSYNKSTSFTNSPYSCEVVQVSKANINAQKKFTSFDIEPPWISKKHFWNNIFDSRYLSLMRNPKWPPLKVILVPRTHVDTIWKKTFEQYNSNIVNKMLSNIVKKLLFYPNMTFTWNEISHLSRWWKITTPKIRTAFRRLVDGGRLEITTGGWIETDEATTHLYGLVHQLIEGHQWLKKHLNYSPQIAWLTNTVTHSPTMTYLLSALGITKLVFTNLHYSWEQYLSEYQISEFIWIQSWESEEKQPSELNNALLRLGKDLYPKHSVLSHYLQFNSNGFESCGPNKVICSTEFNFAKSNKNMDISSYNIKEKSEILLEQYSKSGTITPHNVIMTSIGAPYRYEFQPEFDYQYNNYQRIADYVNTNRDIYKATIEFGTPKNFFDSILERHSNYVTLKGDFTNFADIENGSPAYWVGYFTSRPLLKLLLSRLQSTLRSTEILLSFVISQNTVRGYNMSEIYTLLAKCRENVARLLDRNVVSGTLTVNILRYAHNKITTTAKDCWYIQEVAASLLSAKTKILKPFLHKYVYRDGELVSIFRTVEPGDQIYIFNSLSHERPEVVELFSRTPNIRITDHIRKDITIQVNPVWKYNSDNTVKISRKFFKITFTVTIPPLTLELFKIKRTNAYSQNIATIYCAACVIDEEENNGSNFPFSIQPIEPGDIQLESYKHRLIFDEQSGFLKKVVEKDTYIEKMVMLDYGAFRSSDVNSGTFLFNTNISRPIHDILMPFRAGKKTKLIFIISGQITTELTAVYGRLLQHTVKIYNLAKSPLSGAIYIESKVDFEVSPKNRDLELFLSVQTDIANGNSPELFTDNNGFQYTSRILNMSARLESNVYPMTTMAYIEDHKKRLTLITDHAQGVTALQEGQLIVMLDRRVLFDDGRGSNEGLSDNSAMSHRHYLLLENLFETSINSNHVPLDRNLKLPSLSALFLSNSLMYVLDIFVINRNSTKLDRYAFLPLIKTPFPCNVALLKYRLMLDSNHSMNFTPTKALMILHKQSFSCEISHDFHFQCDEEKNVILDKILRDLKFVYKTNLSGTDKGTPVKTLNQVNFPSMELATLRLQF